MTTYAAGVEGEEYGFLTSTTRRGAIDDALEPLLEEVAAGNKGPGDWTVVVHTAPVWCEGEGCEEHAAEHDRCMVTSAGWTDVRIEVLYEYSEEEEDREPEWRYSDAIEQLREAFPRLVWGHHNANVLTGSLLPGHGRRDEPEGYGWIILVDIEWQGWGLDGPLTDDLRSRDSNGTLGDDRIAGLRAVIEAEGNRLAKEADARAEVARLLGGQPQSDWRAAMAEDSSSYMARELVEARARIAELERRLDEHYRGDEGACEESYRARVASETATVRQLLADATTELSRASLSRRLRRLEEELEELDPVPLS